MRSRRFQVLEIGSSFKAFKAARRKTREHVSVRMISKIIGPKYVSIARSWVPVLTVWGSAGGVALVHFTDWRLFLDYVPYINGKFKKDE